jgi:hypothetical protein
MRPKKPLFLPGLTFMPTCLILSWLGGDYGGEFTMTAMARLRRWGFFCFSAVLLVAGPATARKRPVATVKVKAGYIDSHFAVSPNGKYLAYVHVLNNRSVHLMVMALSPTGMKRRARVPIHNYTVMPLRLHFTKDSTKILMFWRANANAIEGPVKGVVLSLGGQRLAGIPSFQDFRVRKSGGKWLAIIYNRKRLRWNLAHMITVYSFPQMRRTAQYRLVTDKTNRVSKPIKMELVYFIDDYLRALAKVPGRYDKKRDIRLPDREAVYDLKTKKIVRQRDIREAVKWERNKIFRQKHNAFDPIVVLKGAAKRAKLQLVRTNNKRATLTLPLQLARFRSDSLRQQFLPGRKALISLTVDPQNPITLKQRKSEPEVFHLFYFPMKNPSRPKSMTRLKSDKQVIFWHYGKSYLAVMRLHKNWTLGRYRLDVFKVNPPR